jgi:polysaccharide pyruvyl transferase WcaK-like protein
VEMVPDPTFMYDIKPVGVQHKLSQIGIDFNRPILGILLFGHDILSQAIKSHYKSKGYQIVALSMYNPCADFNLGHVLDPFEWAETFRLLTFCITDRFHGAIFCLKNRTPFICLEKDTHLPKSQSKTYDLLSNFNLTRCHVNPLEEKFNSSNFLQHASEIEANWTKSLESVISSKIDAAKYRHQDFLRKIKREISGV